MYTARFNSHIKTECTESLEEKNRISMFCVCVENSTSYYESYDDFRVRANIEGLLVKDIWDEVKEVNYLQ